MVQSKKAAEKAEIHSGLGGFYHNERYAERLKKIKKKSDARAARYEMLHNLPL